MCEPKIAGFFPCFLFGFILLRILGNGYEKMICQRFSLCLMSKKRLV